MKKRVLSLLLCLCMAASLLAGVTVSVSAESIITNESIENAIAYAYDVKNNNPWRFYDSEKKQTYCAAFVWRCYYSGAGIGNSSYATAREMGDALITNTDANPPRGAFVFWYDSNGPQTKAGHVGLSLGDGNVIHAYSDVKITSIATVNSSHYTYRGWGAPIAGYRLATATPTDTAAPTISNVYVDNVTGSEFTIHATLDDNVGVTRVWLNVYGPSDSDGYEVSAGNGSFSHTIQMAPYGGTGSYSVHLYVFDAAGNETPYSYDFYTLAPSDATITANQTDVCVGDTVTLSYSIIGATSRYVSLYKDNAIYKAIGCETNSGTVNYTFTEPGVYCCVTEGSNSLGGTYSENSAWITVSLPNLDPPPADPDAPTVTVASVTTQPGKTADVTLTLANNPGIACARFTLTHDEALTLTSITTGDALPTLTFTQPGDLTADSVYLTWDGVSNDTTNGTALTLTFTVPEGTEDGDYAITLTYDPADVIDAMQNEIAFTAVSGKVTVRGVRPGDLSGDGVVNMKDVLLLRQSLAGGYGVTADPAAADLNHDGVVNMKDILILRQFLAGGYGIVL